MAISEIIRFTLSSTLVPEFTQLRNFVARNYNVKNQYFGYMIAPKNAALPIKKDEMCWVIRSLSNPLVLKLALIPLIRRMATRNYRGNKGRFLYQFKGTYKEKRRHFIAIQFRRFKKYGIDKGSGIAG